jgi:hypothetical protein
MKGGRKKNKEIKREQKTKQQKVEHLKKNYQGLFCPVSGAQSLYLR